MTDLNPAFAYVVFSFLGTVSLKVCLKILHFSLKMLSFNRKNNIQTGYLPSSQLHLPELEAGMGNLFDVFSSNSRQDLVAVYIWRSAETTLSDCSAWDLILHLLCLRCSHLRKKGYILQECLKDRILVLAAD